jgi:hypothetical protein
MFRSRCYNGGQKHNFEERYESRFPPGFNGIGHYKGGDLIGYVESHKEQIYVRDICLWCGKTVERDEHTEK